MANLYGILDWRLMWCKLCFWRFTLGYNVDIWFLEQLSKTGNQISGCEGQVRYNSVLDLGRASKVWDSRWFKNDLQDRIHRT